MSKESIVSDLPTDFVRKMRNWVRASTGNGYAMSSAYEGGMPSSGYAESIIPVLVGEADDVDHGLLKVRLREREAVRLFWIYEGNSLRWLGRRLAVNHETAEVRVRLGHWLLQDVLQRHRAIAVQMQKDSEGAIAIDSSHGRTGSVGVVTRISIRPNPLKPMAVQVTIDKR